MIQNVLTVAHLTLYEARRRRILVAAVLCGAAFLALFLTALFLAYRELARGDGPSSFIERQLFMAGLTLAGLYAANFLAALLAVLLPVDTLSGEIETGIMQTIAAKPIRRGEIILGKWIGHGVIIGAYLTLLISGVLLGSRMVAGPVLANLPQAAGLMLLQVLLLLTMSIAGGTRLSTVTNGVLALGFYGVGFIGGMVEQVGTLSGVQSAKTVGIIASLISPADVLWRFAAYLMQPDLVRDAAPHPLSVAVPSPLMVWWAIGFGALTLLWAVRSFERRAL
jgi:ABC-type transport system involved in multi-copper enzyme maturation permease subunit